MDTFFHGWRRKMGCVTLLMACALTVGWVRSHVRYDIINLTSGGHSYRFASLFGRYRLIRVGLDGRPKKIWWTSKDISHITSEDSESWFFNADGTRVDWEGFNVEWQWAWGMFSFGAGTRQQVRWEIFTFPYWSTAVPLTLLSAHLILGTPRKRSAASTES